MIEQLMLSFVVCVAIKFFRCLTRTTTTIISRCIKKYFSTKSIELVGKKLPDGVVAIFLSNDGIIFNFVPAPENLVYHQEISAFVYSIYIGMHRIPFAMLTNDLLIDFLKL